MMKHRNTVLLAAILCLSLGGAPSLRAQEYTPVPVTVSRSTVNINGRTYYAHIVLERQTIYGIAKAYGVTEDALYAANPSLKDEGLKSGTVIYIPAEKKDDKPVSAAPQTPATPPAAAASAPTGKQDGFPDREGYLKHTVKWFEDIYDVANAYGVTPQEIMDANGLKSSRISKRQVLYIPILSDAEKARRAAAKDKSSTVTPPTVPVIENPTVPETELAAKVDEEPVLPEETRVEELQPAGKPEEENDDFRNWIPGKGHVNIALVLPFNASGKYSESNMDFYAGVLLALRELETEGITSTLNVYDLKAGMPSTFELSRNDFILGPVAPSDIATVLSNAAGVPVISPLDQRAATYADTQRNFIQAPSAAASQYADLAAWAARDAAAGDRIILVSEKNASADPAARMKAGLDEQGVACHSVSFTQAEGRSLPASLTSQLTKGGVNRILLASEKESFVADLVRNLDILRGRGYKVVLYAPSRVRTFDSVEGTSYHLNNLHICSSYFVDYSDARTKAFLRTYRALFKTEPSQFAFQGYDTALYFAGLAGRYGNRWTGALTHVDGKGLHTDFHFEETPAGAYRNTAVRRIVYQPDYATELAR